MQTGTVVTAFERRSFAFIQDDSTGGEFFAHASDFPDRTVLPVGTLVEFDVADFRGRPKAIKIRPLASKSASSAGNFEVRS